MSISVDTAVIAFMQILISGIGFLAWQKIKSLETDLRIAQKEISNIRFNYLNRFDDLKEHVSVVQLKIIERISILETRIEQKLNLGE